MARTTYYSLPIEIHRMILAYVFAGEPVDLPENMITKEGTMPQPSGWIPSMEALPPDSHLESRKFYFRKSTFSADPKLSIRLLTEQSWKTREPVIFDCWDWIEKLILVALLQWVRQDFLGPDESNPWLTALGNVFEGFPRLKEVTYELWMQQPIVRVKFPEMVLESEVAMDWAGSWMEHVRERCQQSVDAEMGGRECTVKVDFTITEDKKVGERNITMEKDEALGDVRLLLSTSQGSRATVLTAEERKGFIELERERQR